MPPQTPPPNPPWGPPTGGPGITPPPTGPTTPGDKPPSGPTTPGGKPPTGPTPPPGPAPTPNPPKKPPTGPSTGRPNVKGRSARRSAGNQTSWRIWWEYNREYMIGVRGMMRETGPITGIDAPADGKHDPMAGRRDEVRAKLRGLIMNKKTRPKLRQACLIALGRVGTEKDVDYFLVALRGENETDAVQTAAALGLGMLPPIKSEEKRAYVREQLDYLVASGGGRSRRVRSFCMLAAGMRARTDKVMAMNLARQCATYIKDGYDAGTLAYACGLSRDALLLPELMYAARRGVMGGVKLDDVARSHAAAGLGFMQSPLSVHTLLLVLKSRRAGVHARRSAVLSLGRLLREMKLDEDMGKRVRKEVLKAFRKDSDAVLRAFASIALAGASEPIAVDELMRVVERSGNPVVKPYAALGLGLAARRLGKKEADGVRKFLRERADKEKEIEFSSALTLALGLAGDAESREHLLERVTSTKLPAPVRASAAEALGLLRKSDPEVDAALLDALHNGPPQLVESASLALGLVGRRSTAQELLKRFKTAESGLLQGALTLALGHLSQSTAVDPLLAILEDKSQNRVTRDLAAVALGILGDPREKDVLFELDAYFNYFATSILTNELLQIF
jgi:HEAT repeat protein